MKKHFLFAALAMTALFSACNNEDPINEEKTSVPVSFTIGGIDSRATLYNNETVFEKDDLVGIFATENAMTPTMSNAQFTVNENVTALVSETQYNYVDATTNVTFSAYYPYSEEALQDGKISFIVGADQTGDNLYLNDFMTAIATGKGTQEDANVSFNFTHQFTFVQLILTDINDANEATLTVPVSQVLWTPASNEISNPTTANSITIQMHKADANTFYALVPAQTTTNIGDAKFVIKNFTNQYIYEVAANTEFQKGKKQSFSLKKAIAGLTLTSINIDDWGEIISTVENENYEEANLNYIVMPTATNINAISSRTDSKITTAGNWGIVNYNNTSDQNTNNTGTATYDSSSKTITFNYTNLGSKTAWYRLGLMYNLGVIPEGYTGNLSMKIKAENSDGTAVANAGYGIYLIYGPSDNGDNFYGLTSGNNIYIAGNWNVGSTGETTRAVTVDMSKYYTGISPNDVTNTEGSSIESNTKNAFLLVIPRDNGSVDCSTLTYKISNITFTLTPTV